MAINKELESLIVRKLFFDATEVSWLNLTGDQRSAMYQQWIEDPEVGGRLASYMNTERARVWVKDGPMKEYTRSLCGVGKYAELVPSQAVGVRQLVTRVLGSGWDVDMTSLKIKPLRVSIINGESESYFAWALGKEPKHLCWAAIKAEADGDITPWVLCLVGSFENPIAPDEREINLRRARRCGLRLEHVDGL